MLMHVITDFSSPGGAETMLARLLQVSEDDRVLVVPLIGTSERNERLAGNPRAEFIPLGARTPLAFAGASLELAGLIRRERPTAVLCWMYHAIIAGTVAARLSWTGVPVFWNIRQSLDDPAALSRSSRAALKLAATMSRLPRGIIYNSARALGLHAERGYTHPNSVVIPNGFAMPELQYPVRSDTPQVFGIAGRFLPKKDHATFFRAAALTLQTHPEARFVAAGFGLSPDNPEMAGLLEAAGLPPDRIDLRGELGDMAGFYHDIDALVLSSRTEGFPNVVAEAMAYGKPVVTTDVGDAAFVVGDTGYVVPPRNADKLASAMRSLLDLSPECYSARAHAARERIESHFALPAVARRYRDFVGA